MPSICCENANPYMSVNLIAKSGSKCGAKCKSDTQSNISKSTYSSTEVICVGENTLVKKGINREAEKNGDLDIPGKVVNMR